MWTNAASMLPILNSRRAEHVEPSDEAPPVRERVVGKSRPAEKRYSAEDDGGREALHGLLIAGAFVLGLALLTVVP